jgi:hypothetical protein
VPERESLRGVGRDASGPHTFTVQIHHYIGEHPGVTFDEILQVALDRDWVDRGYAHRAYARQLNAARHIARRRDARASGKQPDESSMRLMADETPASIARERSDKAVRFAVKTVVTSMCKGKALAMDEEGGYHVLRDLKATEGITRDQIITTPEGNRQLASEIELLRAVRPILHKLGAKGAGNNTYHVPLPVQRALKRWAEATYVHRPPTPPGSEDD